MNGLEQRYVWVVTNESFEKALEASKAKRNDRRIPSPFLFGTITFSSEQDLTDFLSLPDPFGFLYVQRDEDTP